MPELLDLPPGDLLVDRNLRTDPGVDKEFTASIARHGVLVPVVAVRTPDGAYRVRHGHRRVAAALKAKLATIPVVDAGDEDNDDVERILHQWAENEHRAGLTTSDRISAITQLAAFGVRAGAIATGTGTPKADVEQHLAVGRSALAAAAAARYDFLDLVQAAGVAEFEHDKNAVAKLVAAAKTGDFDHVVKRMRQDRDEEAKIAARLDELRAAGVAIIGVDVDLNVIAKWWDPASQVSLTKDLAGAADPTEPMTDDEHATCEHRAARVTTAHWRPDGLETEMFCLDWRAAGHQKRHPAGRERDTTPDPAPAPAAGDEQARARWAVEEEARKELAAARRAADGVRREYIRRTLMRAKPDKSLQQPLLAALVAALITDDTYFEADPIDAARLAGKLPDAYPTASATPDDDEQRATATEALATMHPELALLAILLAQGEDDLRTDPRYSVSGVTRHYQLLRTAGYTLAPCEQDLLDELAARAEQAGRG